MGEKRDIYIYTHIHMSIYVFICRERDRYRYRYSYTAVDLDIDRYLMDRLREECMDARTWPQWHIGWDVRLQVS